MKRTTITRRQFLRLTALGLGAATLGACKQVTSTPTSTVQPVRPSATPTAQPSRTSAPTHTVSPEPTRSPQLSRTPVAEVTITTSGWPLDAKSADEAKTDPSSKAQRDAIQVWLDQHPGIDFRRVYTNIWDPKTIAAQVAAGTDSTYLFGPCVGGGWGREQAIHAFQRGQLADVSAFVGKYRLQERLLPYYWDSWRAFSQVDNRFFCYPLNQTVPSATTFVFRKDILEKLDLDIPKIGWTWDEMAELLPAVTDLKPAKPVYGLVTTLHFLSLLTTFYGAEVLTDLPAPDRKWHWVSDWSDPRWIDVVKSYRKGMYRDHAIFSDATIAGETEVLSLFREGRTVFAMLNYWSMFGAPTDFSSLSAMSDRLGKNFADLFSVVPAPTGDGFQMSNNPEWGPVSFSPNQTTEQLDAAVSLLEWMFFGKGLDLTRLAMWEVTRDPRTIFSAFLYMDGREGYDGITARAEDAWGADLVERWKKIGRLPVRPRKEDFFPPENTPPPDRQSTGEPLLPLISDSKDMRDKEIAEQFRKIETDWNRTLEMFSSDISAADFKEAALKYYAALDDYFRINMPDFYLKRYLPFYKARIEPVIR